MLLCSAAFLAGVAGVLVLERLPGPAVLAGATVVALAVWRWAGPWPLAAALGFALACMHGHRALEADWPCARDRESVVLEGVVTSPPEPGARRIDFDFEPGRHNRAAGIPPRLRLSWYEPAVQPLPGQRWRLTARLRCRSGFSNPGGYDRELALLRNGYGATGYLSRDGDARLLGRRVAAAPVQSARAWLAARIGEDAGHTSSVGVLQGLAVGLRGRIAPELNDAFVATGTVHLIAISGMHVTGFAVAALMLTRSLRRFAGGPGLSPRWPALQAATVLTVTFGYGLLAGASLPTVRTVCMVGIAVGLRVMRRRAAAAEILAAAAVLLAVIDPLAMTSAGFWLSFVAVAGLIGLIETAGGPLPLVRTFLRAQAAVTVVLAPVLVAAFGAVSTLGPLVNAVAIPLFSFAILPLTLTATALLPLFPGPAGALWAGLGNLLDRCWPVLLALGGWPPALFAPPAAPPWLLALGVASALAAIVVPGAVPKLAAACLLGTLLLRPAPAPPPGGFELAVLDVGQGLSAVVRTHRHTLVFDTGPRWSGGGDAARVTLLPYLRAAGVDSVDVAVLSHADADHAGGIDSLRRAVRVRETFGDTALPLAADRPCTSGQRWSWDGVRFTVLHPPAGGGFAGNDGSCALRVDGRGGSALLLADPQAHAERAMSALPLAADVVLVPHHGSATSSGRDLVAAVGARVAIVSSGYGNRWGFPREEVVRRWSEAGAQVHGTAEGGAISVRVLPGEGVGPVRRHREQNPRWWRRPE